MGKDDFYIQVLTFAANKQTTGFTGEEFTAWVSDNYGPVSPKFSSIVNKLISECFEGSHLDNRSHVYSLKIEYLFRLIEFQELEESRKASSDANKHSKIAIGFSMAAIFVGLVIGIIQLKSEIKLSPEQVSVMATKDLPVTQQVESEQLAKVIEALKQSNINTAELTRMIREQNKQVGSGEVKYR